MDSTINKTKNGIFGTALAILILLTIISAILLTIRLVDYIKVDEKEVLLESGLDKEFDLFSVQYENESGEITVSGTDGQKVVAPGTAVEYTIRLRNKGDIAIDYNLTPVVSFTTEHIIPIQVRMLDYDGNYIIGDAKTWVEIKDIADISEMKTLVKGESTEYIFEWRWIFESGNDEHDTFLGSISKDANVGLAVSFNVHSEANTDIGTNGGVVKSGLGDIIFIGVVLIMLIIAIALLLVYITKKRNHKNI